MRKYRSGLLPGPELPKTREWSGDFRTSQRLHPRNPTSLTYEKGIHTADLEFSVKECTIKRRNVFPGWDILRTPRMGPMKATLALVLGLAAVLLFAPAARADLHAAKSPYRDHVAALGHDFGGLKNADDGGDDHEGSDDNHEHEGSEGSGQHGDGHDHGGDDSASDGDHEDDGSDLDDHDSDDGGSDDGGTAPGGGSTGGTNPGPGTPPGETPTTPTGPSTQATPGGIGLWLWILLLIVIAGAGVSTAYVLRRRRMRSQ